MIRLDLIAATKCCITQGAAPVTVYRIYRSAINQSYRQNNAAQGMTESQIGRGGII